MFADDSVHPLLEVGRQVTIGEVVAAHSLMSGYPSAFKKREEGGEDADPCGPCLGSKPWGR